MKYGAWFEWYPRLGERQFLEVSECDTLQEAIDGVRQFAINSGYTPPRWWQLWRWGERPLPAAPSDPKSN